MKRWRMISKKACLVEDCWEPLNIHIYCPTLRAKRHRYDIQTDTWVQDIVSIKIEEKSFSEGSMRVCYRAKKLSNTRKHDDNWVHPSNNFVVKQYKDKNVSRSTYFNDVYLQMASKKFGIEYNKMDVPKKVDFIQLAVIEVIDGGPHANKSGKPAIYTIENFIEGEYIKYNSNSGFVENELYRLTPQTFSHFTLEKSNGLEIVVDVQGVGDLYTDPQIHTLEQQQENVNSSFKNDYDIRLLSDGNLGLRGISLFVRSHYCNPLCRKLNLKRFFKSKLELLQYKQANLATNNSSLNNSVGSCDSVAVYDVSGIKADFSLYDFENLKNSLQNEFSMCISNTIKTELNSSNNSFDQKRVSEPSNVNCDFVLSMIAKYYSNSYFKESDLQNDMFKVYNTLYHIIQAASLNQSDCCLFLACLIGDFGYELITEMFFEFTNNDFDVAKNFFIDIKADVAENFELVMVLLHKALATSSIYHNALENSISFILGEIYDPINIDNPKYKNFQISSNDNCHFKRDACTAIRHFESYLKDKGADHVTMKRVSDLYKLVNDMEKSYSWLEMAAESATNNSSPKAAMRYYELMEEYE